MRDPVVSFKDIFVFFFGEGEGDGNSYGKVFFFLYRYFCFFLGGRWINMENAKRIFHVFFWYIICRYNMHSGHVFFS